MRTPGFHDLYPSRRTEHSTWHSPVDYGQVFVPNFHPAVLIIDPSIERKLRHEHNLTGDQVREVVLYRDRRHVEARWDVDDKNGERWIVQGKCYDGTEIIAYVMPVVADPDVYVLKTAYPLT